MKRSQINYVIDKAHAIAQTFRVCLPEFAYFTVDDWLQRERDNWQEVVDLQLGWDITDFGHGDFNQTGLTLLTMRNGALGAAYSSVVHNPASTVRVSFCMIILPLFRVGYSSL